MLASTDVVRAGIFVAWAVFGIGMAARTLRRGGTKPERRAEPAALVGVALQGLAFFLFFGLGRRLAEARPDVHGVAGLAVEAAALALAAASAWLGVSAFARLGEQWSIRARILEGHALVTSGPYRIVRQPIYSALLGLIIATGVALGRWVSLAVAVPLFVAGTLIRIRREERLLRAAFGEAHASYVRRVRALVPFVW